MNTRNVALVFTMALLAGCRTAPVGVEAGPNGVLSATLTINDDKILVEGRDGSLFVNGEVRGEVREGDWVTVDWDGSVQVNGKLR
tara:strand:+ start:19121 stop:19375 length:255 start_codon:yes stop_codon:yes gene_type:complete